LLDVGLVELFKDDLATVMLAKKDTFGNWTEHHMCGDFHPMNKRTYAEKYAMTLLEEIFNALGHAKVFNTLDLRSGYH
jgi:hypothetical protein